MKRTKIIATMGPACGQHELLISMIQAGMNVARFNFSHGTHQEHLMRIQAVRAAERETGISVALLLDTKGPEARIGSITRGSVFLTAGDEITLTGKPIDGSVTKVSVKPPQLIADIKPGMMIQLSDGLIGLRALECRNGEVLCEILNNGQLSSNKRITIPGIPLSIPALSKQDVNDLLFGVDQGIDAVAVSFVQTPGDVLGVRRVLEEAGSRALVIAKIENTSGVENLPDILKVADGIMVARGDLGVEIPAEEVPLVQKRIIALCNRAGKPVITATQMLESMIDNPRPTRAEASDVANAILDGSDALMLSGETAAGKYPLGAVETMARIAMRTEREYHARSFNGPNPDNCCATITDAVSQSTVRAADLLQAKAILTSTESGHTARMVTKYRPQSPIIAVSPNQQTVKQLMFSYGVTPLLGKSFDDSDAVVRDTIAIALEYGLISKGDLVVITAGLPAGTPGTTNLMKIQVIGDVLLRGTGIGQQVVTGPVRVITQATDWNRFAAGEIVVIREVAKDDIEYLQRAAAIIAEAGGLTSEAAVFGVSFNIPVIVGAENATGLLHTGMEVTADTPRGVVYRGQADAK